MSGQKAQGEEFPFSGIMWDAMTRPLREECAKRQIVPVIVLCQPDMDDHLIYPAGRDYAVHVSVRKRAATARDSEKGGTE